MRWQMKSQPKKLNPLPNIVGFHQISFDGKILASGAQREELLASGHSRYSKLERASAAMAFARVDKASLR